MKLLGIKVKKKSSCQILTGIKEMFFFLPRKGSEL